MPARTDGCGFAILGRSFHMRRVPARVRDWVEWHWHHGYETAASSFAVELDWLPDEPPVLEGEPVRATLPGLELGWVSDGAAWEWRDASSSVRLDLSRAGARISAWSDRDEDPAIFAALYVAMVEAVRASGLVPLHAAVALPPARAEMTERAGAVAFTGASGAGKSTTLLRLVREGWIPLAEDLSWIDPASQELFGWDRGVRVWPDTIAAFLPDLADAGWNEGTDGKLFLPYESLVSAAPFHSPRRAQLTGVAVVERAPDDDSAWERLDGRTAVKVLWECAGVPLSAAARETTAAWVAGAGSRLELYRLRVGKLHVPDPPPTG